jgi:nucleoside triphosphate diphosphatase
MDDPSMPRDDSAEAVAELLALMARLRDPERGCPWDAVQTFATIAPYTIEEAYEVADAIQRDAMGDLRDELGDLLFQVVFHARMAEERGAFRFHDVARGIVDKMIRRHPHVFGEAPAVDRHGMPERWEQQKAEERHARAAAEGRAPSVLDGVAAGLPALTRAMKLQRRAARVGFDWPEAEPILDKMAEEIEELRAELRTGAARGRVEDEVGDLMFAVVNLARRLEVDPEAALRGTNAKFERRFRHVETELAAASRPIAEATLDEMEALWVEAKRREG